MFWVWLGTFALVVVFLPPNFDPAIYIKERQMGWPIRSFLPPMLGVVGAAVVATVVIQFV